jgi:hypothetical protein
MNGWYQTNSREHTIPLEQVLIRFWRSGNSVQWSSFESSKFLKKTAIRWRGKTKEITSSHLLKTIYSHFVRWTIKWKRTRHGTRRASSSEGTESRWTGLHLYQSSCFLLSLFFFQILPRSTAFNILLWRSSCGQAHLSSCLFMKWRECGEK